MERATDLKTIKIRGCNLLTISDEFKSTRFLHLEECHIEFCRLVVELDLGVQASLTKLVVQNNGLRRLDVSGLTMLSHLEASSNQLTDIDVS